MPSNTVVWRKWTLWVLAWIVATVFIYSGMVKLMDLQGFAQVLYRYDLLPSVVVNLTAMFVASLEVILAIALLMNRGFRAPAAILAAILLLVFAGLAALTIHRGLNIACGCFSTDPNSARVGWWTVGRNLSLALMCFSVMYLECRQSSHDSAGSPNAPSPPNDQTQSPVTG